MSTLDFPHDYIIRTQRLLLRPPEPGDVDALWPHVTNPEVTRFLAWEPHEDKEMTLRLINSLIQAQQAQKGYHWVLVRDMDICGLVSLIDVRRQHRCWTLDRAELAYWLAPKFQKQGLMTESCKAILDFAFNGLNLHKVIAFHASDNPPSGRVIQRLGFRYVGEEVEAFCKSGHWHNLKQYEVLEKELWQ